jgi:hypothetical protein
VPAKMTITSKVRVGLQDMMAPMMMMTMMGSNRKGNGDGNNAALMEQLKKQNEMIMALNSGNAGGGSKDGESNVLMNRLHELEEKLATKLNKTNQGSGGM